MSRNMVNGNMPMVNRAYLITTAALYGPDTLNRDHAQAKYTLLVGTIAEVHNKKYSLPNCPT